MPSLYNDGNVHQLIVGLQNEINGKTSLSFEFNQKINDFDSILLEFYSYLLKHRKSSKSKLFQGYSCNLFIMINQTEL